MRRTAADGALITISASDPLNLCGIIPGGARGVDIDAGDRVRAAATNKIVYRDGIAIAAMEGDYVRPLGGPGSIAASEAAAVTRALTGRRAPAVVSGFIGR